MCFYTDTRKSKAAGCPCPNNSVFAIFSPSFKAKKYIPQIVFFYLYRNAYLSPRERNRKRKGNAGLTIEAAIVLPVIIAMVVCLTQFFVVFSFQTKLAQNMANASKEVSRYRYAYDIGCEGIESVGTGTYLAHQILTDGLREDAKKAGIRELDGGTMISSNLYQNEYIDITVAYQVTFSFLPSEIGTLNLANRSYCRTFIGSTINAKELAEKSIVYITETGKVYHLTTQCTYINLSTTLVKYSELVCLRNNNGAKYKACEKCVSGLVNGDDKVYITMEGKKYHVNKSCSGLKRTVKEVKLDSLTGYRLCTKCQDFKNMEGRKES